MSDPRGRHVGFNAASSDQWAGFAGHRAKVSELLAAGATTGRSRLCVLGVGNGNDLDLPALLRAYREVHLVDLDGEALTRCLVRQGVADHPGLHRFAGIDLTGMLDAIAGWSPLATIDRDTLNALIERPARVVGLALPGPYDCVTSTCLLSPLVGNAFHSIGEAHPQFGPVVGSIRTGHLRLLAGLAAPGGTAVLITDLVSSTTLPGLATVPESSLPGLLPRLVRDRNHFFGLNPERLWSLVRDDPILNARVNGRESIAPWRWNLHDRLYLVWAMRWRMAPAQPVSSHFRI